LGPSVDQDPLTLAGDALSQSRLVGDGLSHLSENLSNDSLIHQDLAAGRHSDAVLEQILEFVNQVKHGSVHSSVLKKRMAASVNHARK
jgi:hypothetical protein